MRTNPFAGDDRVRRIRGYTIGNSNKTNDPVAHYTGVGVAFGISFGVALGAAFDEVGIGVALGVALGPAIGAGIGMSLKKKQKSNEY